jgi:hypothetical protein
MLLEVLFVLPILVFAQNVTITTQDSRMHYDGTWVVQDLGGHEFTTTVGSSVSLAFQGELPFQLGAFSLHILTSMLGTAIYWHATINPRCGVANVSVDHDAGVLVDPSIGTTTNSTPLPAILYEKSGLNPETSHLINITLLEAGSLGGPYMEVYNLS